jgi:hypothetical protein
MKVIPCYHELGLFYVLEQLNHKHILIKGSKLSFIKKYSKHRKYRIKKNLWQLCKVDCYQEYKRFKYEVILDRVIHMGGR